LAGRRRKTSESNEQNVTLIMIAVVLVFIITNVPAKVVQIAWSYRQQACPSIEYLVVEFSVVFELLGSAINFFVYCAFLRRFRTHLSAACPTLWRRLVPARLQNELDSTGTTTVMHMQQRPSCTAANTVFVGAQTPLVGRVDHSIKGNCETPSPRPVGGRPVALMECDSA
jgi:hypothetical protein